MYIVGAILVVVILACGGLVFALRSLGNAVTNAGNNLATTIATTTTFQQTSTTGEHITKIQTGTGFDQNSGLVQGEKSTFTTSDQIWVVYTVSNPDPNATVTLTLEPGGETANSAALDNVTNQYANQVQVSDPGIYTVEIDYNDTPEATIDFQVTD